MWLSFIFRFDAIVRSGVAWATPRTQVACFGGDGAIVKLAEVARQIVSSGDNPILRKAHHNHRQRCAPRLRLRSCFFGSQSRYEDTVTPLPDQSKGCRMVIGPNFYAKAYKPGQLVPISGIYTVVHVKHRPDHQVIAIRGDQLPHCRVCRANVTFYPTQPVTHMTHDFDLAGPCLQIARSRAKAAKRGVG